MSYRSYADLGGQGGHGAVDRRGEDELFHAAWEPRVLAVTLAMGATGLWNIDASRAARETLAEYSQLSYYRVWLEGLEKLLQHSGAMQEPPVHAPRVLHAEEVSDILARGSPTIRHTSRPARYAVDQWVRCTVVAPPHHTRLPGYARGKRGLVERVHGAHVFADTHAQGLGEQPQWLYTVAFDEKELWGADWLPQGSVVSVDAWESYLEPA